MILLGCPFPLPEHELVVVGEEVVERHAAVHRGSDHRPSVRAGISPRPSKGTMRKIESQI